MMNVFVEGFIYLVPTVTSSFRPEAEQTAQSCAVLVVCVFSSTVDLQPSEAGHTPSSVGLYSQRE